MITTPMKRIDANTEPSEEEMSLPDVLACIKHLETARHEAASDGRSDQSDHNP